jgi:ribonuclease G
MKKILITSRPWEKRIAIIQNKLLQSIYFDSKSSFRLEKSFFKGQVAKILPGVQTAFVDIGQEKAGFLHISEIDRDLAFKKMNGFDNDEIEDETSGRSYSHSREVNISSIFKQGEYILVQVSKEPINEKGAKLTTCFTLPGRFIVLMPNISKVGISKKIIDPSERKRLKDAVLSVLPENAGCIIRTTCEGKKDEEIIQDLKYLLDIWNNIQKKFKEEQKQTQIYQDIDLTLQIVRDHLDESVESIICDNQETYNTINKFIGQVANEYLNRSFFYNEKISLFESYEVETQIQRSLQSKVTLDNGGSIIIDSTEAMTVIDVNTAKFVGSTNLEDTLFKTNMEAAKEIVRQLKLRNIGGLIVIDFIDMMHASNKNKLFSYFEKTLKEEDKSQSVLLKISEFGLVQMTRKRSGKTLRHQLLDHCEHCNGTGMTKTFSTRAYELFRALDRFILKNDSKLSEHVNIIIDSNLAKYIIEIEYDTLLFFEKKYKIRPIVKQDDSIGSNYHFEN